MSMPTAEPEVERICPSASRITQYQPVDARLKRESGTTMSAKFGSRESIVALTMVSTLKRSWLMRLESSARA
jgi:hypothetical protein